MATLDGTWQLEIATPMGLRRSTLELDQFGDLVSGTVVDEAGTTAIREGRVEGQRLTFLLDVRRPFKMTLAFDLTVDGDQLDGVSKPGRFPASKVTGTRAGSPAGSGDSVASPADADAEHLGPKRKVLVVGAGLAGLSAGIAFARRGHTVHLVDLHARVEGAQIGISARAVDALDELGVLDAVRAEANVLMAPVFGNQFDSDGTRLPGPDFDVPPRPDGIPAMVVIYRPHLARILEVAAVESGVEIRRPLRVESFSDEGDGVSVTFSDESVARYDLVVGAEGVHSPTRRALFGEETDPKYVGLMSLRWLVDDMDPGQAGFYHGQGGATVIVGLMPDRMSYVASAVRMENRRVNSAEARELLDAMLGGFEAPYLRALHARLGDDAEIVVRPYETVRLTADWHRGNVVVIGDAAHATTPNLSSGGGMALEDGVVLAHEISVADTIETGLAAFAARRRPRAELVVDASLELMDLEERGAPQELAMPVRMSAMSQLASPY